MERTMTPCLPRKSCVICESRLYPKSASPEKRAAKYAHQARWFGRIAIIALHNDNELAVVEAVKTAAGFARLALDTNRAIALAA
jgi:hypothetical protein